jgi:hypothetical protein
MNNWLRGVYLGNLLQSEDLLHLTQDVISTEKIGRLLRILGSSYVFDLVRSY